MTKHSNINKAELHQMIRRRDLVLAGNLQLKIYGRLHCRSGKRMKKENRVFFTTEQEAVQNGYRPCGHCLKSKHQEWKLKYSGEAVFREQTPTPGH